MENTEEKLKRLEFENIDLKQTVLLYKAKVEHEKRRNRRAGICGLYIIGVSFLSMFSRRTHSRRKGL